MDTVQPTTPPIIETVAFGAPRPDALMFPAGWDHPALRSDVARPMALILYCEELIGAKPYLRYGDPVFVSGSPHDTILFPTDHPKAGFPRYDWKERGDGLLLGYLKPEGGS